jgi:hypothetical protein
VEEEICDENPKNVFMCQCLTQKVRKILAIFVVEEYPPVSDQVENSVEIEVRYSRKISIDRQINPAFHQDAVMRRFSTTHSIDLISFLSRLRNS